MFFIIFNFIGLYSIIRFFKNILQIYLIFIFKLIIDNHIHKLNDLRT